MASYTKDRCVARLGIRWGFALIGLFLIFCTSGCVTRRLTIRSNPPGALVYVDDYKIGATPVSHNFIYYGTRKIRLVKDGYETLTVMQSIPMPWYEIPPLDFVSENFVPGEIRDHRTITYQLTPQCVAQRDQLLARAEGLRGQVQGGRSTVLPPVASGPVQPPLSTIPPPANTWPQPGQNTVAPETLPAPIGFGPRDPLPAVPPQQNYQQVYPQPGSN